MSLPRELARLAVGTIDATLNAVRLVIWVPVGLLLFVGIAGVVFAPVLEHLANYWWVYLLAIAVLVAVVYLVLNSTPYNGESRHVDQPRHVLPCTEHSVPLVKPTTPEEQPTTQRPTSGYALFRFTDEWITRNGMYDGRDMSKVDAIKTAGRTTISYHLREGNFVEREGKIALTAKGKAHFAKRRSRL